MKFYRDKNGQTAHIEMLLRIYIDFFWQFYAISTVIQKKKRAMDHRPTDPHIEMSGHLEKLYDKLIKMILSVTSAQNKLFQNHKKLTSQGSLLSQILNNF